MGKQQTNIPLNDYEKNVLNLEKKYFSIIESIINSDDFFSDLALIEKEISDNYSKFDNLWNLKNKIKVPAERVVRHHLYIKMVDLIKGIFPSPLSSDYGIRTDDAVICIDIKTIDTKGNPGDLKATCVEKNQTSFNNKNYEKVNIQANMHPVDDYTRIPILTYIIKIVYTDDGYSFKLSRESYPTIILTCIPNGNLSKLFDYNIVANCKTYDYFDPIHDGENYTPIKLTKEQKDNESLIDELCLSKGFNKLTGYGKPAYFDIRTRTVWWKTSENKTPTISPVKGGASVRYVNEILKERYDSNGTPWTGYIEWTIKK